MRVPIFISTGACCGANGGMTPAFCGIIIGCCAAMQICINNSLYNNTKSEIFKEGQRYEITEIFEFEVIIIDIF